MDALTICTRCAATFAVLGPAAPEVAAHLVAAHAIPPARLTAETLAILTGRERDGACITCGRRRGHLLHCRLRPAVEVRPVEAPSEKPCWFCTAARDGRCSRHGGDSKMQRHREVAREAQRRYRARLVAAAR